MSWNQDNIDLELFFISGKFLEINLPKEKEYLFKYFRTPLQQSLIQYYLIFGSLTKFIDHTGYACNPWWIRDLKRKLKRLEEAHTKAKQEMDLEKLTKIEVGKYKVKY